MGISKTIYKINDQTYYSLEEVPKDYQKLFKTDRKNVLEDGIRISVKTQKLGNDMSKIRYLVNGKEHDAFERIPDWAKNKIEKIRDVNIIPEETLKEISISNQVFDIASDLITSVLIHILCVFASVSLLWELQRVAFTLAYKQLFNTDFSKYFPLLLSLLSSHLGYRLVSKYYKKDHKTDPYNNLILRRLGKVPFGAINILEKTLFGFYCVGATLLINALVIILMLFFTLLLP